LRLVIFYLRDSDLRGGDGDDKGVPLGGVEEVGEKHGLWLGEQDCEGHCADVKDLVGEEGGEKFFIIRRASPETVFASEVVVLVEPVVGFVGVLFINLVDVVFGELDEAVENLIEDKLALVLLKTFDECLDHMGALHILK
jgi:hypothetical protein